MAKRSKPAATPAPQYVPTDRERAAIEPVEQYERGGVHAPSFKVANTKGRAVIGLDHADTNTGRRLLIASLGITDGRLAGVVTSDLASISTSKGEISEMEMNYGLTIIQSIGPRDPVELLLATQMAAIHLATMSTARTLRGSTTIVQQDSNGNLVNKLARTFATQVEALKRHRAKGEQRVVVEHQHIHVHQGGQAVVGNVTTGGGGRGTPEIGELPHERNDERMRLPMGAAVLGALEANGLPVSGTSREGLERVPVPRGAGRSETGSDA